MATDADKVRGFLELAIPAFAADIDNEMIVEFLTQMQNVIGIDHVYNLILLSKVSNFTQVANLIDPPIASGSFGAVHLCSTAGRCYKIMRFNTNPDDENDFFAIQQFFQAIKECFIQYFLSQDTTYGANVPRIYSISKIINAAYIIIYIEMDLGSRDLYRVLHARPAISFDDFYNLVKKPLTVLKHFNITYGFVHRDFKLNNILLKYDGAGNILHEGTYQIIDFGFSCINIRGPDDTVFLIKTKSLYDGATQCRQQQDMLLFFMFYIDYCLAKSDADVHAFLSQLIPPAYYANIQPRLNAQHGPHKKKYKASYNQTGELTAPGQAGATLTIDYVLAQLEGANFWHGPGPGAAAAIQAAVAPPAAASPYVAIGSYGLFPAPANASSSSSSNTSSGSLNPLNQGFIESPPTGGARLRHKTRHKRRKGTRRRR